MSIGRCIGDRYRVIRQIGRGGLAVVYLARQTDLDRDVALKEFRSFYAPASDLTPELHPGDPAFSERFLRESRVAGSLNHPNILTVYDYFEYEGTPYISSEYIERGSLRPWIRIGKLSLAQIAGVLEGVLAGLAHAETRGIVHGDLKPENLMVTGEGSVKIADFGIAAAFHSASHAGRPPTDTTFGTPSYMAPEQALAHDTGPWSDLYAVGVIAYEMLLGRVPFDDDTLMGVLVKLVSEPIPAPRTVDPGLDSSLANWLEKLLAKSPEDRTRSAREAWDDLEEIVLRLLGARWRRGARLNELVPAADTEKPKPLTPAPFDEATDFEPAEGFEAPAEAEVFEPPAPAPAPAAPGDTAGARAFGTYPPARRSELRVLLREAALTGVIPATSAPMTGLRADLPTFGSPVFERTPSTVPARSFSLPLPTRAAAGLVAGLLLLGGIVAAAKWLLGLFVDWDDPRGTDGDFVHFTVFAPPSAAPNESILVQVFVHLPDEAEDARAIATELDTEARRRAFRSLETLVRVGSRLEFELQPLGLQVDEPVASLVWRRRTEAVQFGVTVPSHTPLGTVIGTVSVSIDSVPVGHVKFKLTIEPQGARRSSEPQGEEARRYRVAFISYSSENRDEVLRRVQLLSIVGIKYFQDVLSLEPGERWLKRIELGIDECDLFLLFWSSEAKQSEWVRQEVRYALARKGADDMSPPEIRPVVIEGPPIVEPWEELAHLHFNDRFLYFIRPDSPLGKCRACGYHNEEAADFCGSCGTYLH